MLDFVTESRDSHFTYTPRRDRSSGMNEEHLNLYLNVAPHVQYSEKSYFEMMLSMMCV